MTYTPMQLVPQVEPTIEPSPLASARLQRKLTVEEAARIARAHFDLGGGGVLLARPPADGIDELEPVVAEALAEARRKGVRGQAVTPFVLERLHAATSGRSAEVNRRLIVDNAALAGAVAAAWSALSPSAFRNSSISSAGSVSMRVLPRAPSEIDTRAIVASSGASTMFTKSNSPSVAHWWSTFAPSSSTSRFTSRSRAGFDLSVCTPLIVSFESRM